MSLAMITSLKYQLKASLRGLHTTSINNWIQKLSRLRVVDNSEIGKKAMMEGKPPKCIQVYNKAGKGKVGDKVLVAIKGEKKHGILVGLKAIDVPGVPRFDTNNVVLVDETGTPLGTRIHVPIPHILRTRLKDMRRPKKSDYSKIIALATHFV